MAFMLGINVANTALDFLLTDLPEGVKRSTAKPWLSDDELEQAEKIGMDDIERFVCGSEEEQAELVVEFNAIEFDNWVQRCFDGDLHDVFFYNEFTLEGESNATKPVGDGEGSTLSEDDAAIAARPEDGGEGATEVVDPVVDNVGGDSRTDSDLP